MLIYKSRFMTFIQFIFTRHGLS